MYHIIKDDIYYLYSEDNIELMKIELTDIPGDQVVITTSDEIYAGPIKFITFSGDIPKE